MKQGVASLRVHHLAAELVVIVVGVLVALAVDDLRERRADHDLARHLLESVAADLRADVAELEEVLRDARSVQEASDRILIEAGRPGSDGAATRDPSELAPDVALLIGGIDFDLSDVAYREMTSTGGLQRALVRLGVAPLRPEIPRLEVAVSDPEVRALVAELGARGELMESAHERFLEAATALLAKTEDQAGKER